MVKNDTFPAVKYQIKLKAPFPALEEGTLQGTQAGFFTRREFTRTFLRRQIMNTPRGIRNVNVLVMSPVACDTTLPSSHVSNPTVNAISRPTMATPSNTGTVDGKASSCFFHSTKLNTNARLYFYASPSTTAFSSLAYLSSRGNIAESRRMVNYIIIL